MHNIDNCSIILIDAFIRDKIWTQHGKSVDRTFGSDCTCIVQCMNVSYNYLSFNGHR